MPEIPNDLLEAIDRGILSKEQLRRLIELEAKALGLSYGEAIKRAKTRDLPKNVLGSELQSWISLLPA